MEYSCCCRNEISLNYFLPIVIRWVHHYVEHPDDSLPRYESPRWHTALCNTCNLYMRYTMHMLKYNL